MGQTLLRIGAASLLQIGASGVTNCGSYYRFGQSLLQNRAVVTSWGTIYITDWSNYYKLRHSQFLFKFFIKSQESVFLQFLHHSSISWDIILVYFFTENFIFFGQKEPSKWKFSDFPLLAWKLTKFFVSFFKPRVCFLLNLASPFSVISIIPTKFSS